jgi:hypothetical protein
MGLRADEHADWEANRDELLAFWKSGAHYAWHLS